MRVSPWLSLGLTLVACNPDADGDGFKKGDDCDDAVGTVSVKAVFYLDADGDGFGDPGRSEEACEAPTDKVADSTDCDDADATAHPGGMEVCGGGDEDCDGAVDDADSDVTGTSTFYADLDGDLYGDPATGTDACAAPADFVDNDEDCDDGRKQVNPGSIEICDGSNDEDCDGAIDDADSDAVGKTVWYDDLDGDGFGDPESVHEACAGDTTESTDCDDTRGDVNPGAPDTTCDGVDNDCDGGEAGLATFIDPSGASLDAATWLTGTAEAPAVWSPPDAGTLYLCEGTWYVSATIQHDFDLVAPHGADSTTLSGGNIAPVLHIGAGATTVSLSGVSIIEGYGGSCGAFGGWSGAGICCDTSATVAGDDLVIRDNYGIWGAVGVSGRCDLELTDSKIVDNIAWGAAAGAVIGADFRIVDSEVSRNSALQAVGALYVGGGAATLVLDGTVLEDNSAPDYGGAVYASDGVVECHGDASSSAGFRRNIDGGYPYAAAVMLGYGTFVSEGCDFAPDGDADDNSPADVYTYYGGEVDYGDDATFTCDFNGCL